MTDFIHLTLAVFLQFLTIGLALLGIASARNSRDPLIAIFFFFIAFYLNSIFSFYILNSSIPFSNWYVKGFEFIWPCLLIYVCKWLSPQEAGFRFPKHKTAFFWSAIIGAVFAIINIIEMIVWTDFPSFDQSNTMNVLYQFTMPGLGEEAVYRGVLLAILNLYLGKQWKFVKMQFGWGVILVSILFIFVHLLIYSKTQQKLTWDFSLINLKILPQIILFSFALGFIREKTQSIWPCVLCHNLMNGIVYIGIVWLSRPTP